MTMSSRARIAIYGRTYWDAEVALPVAGLGEGKGKVDATIAMVVGGFPCNAARAISAQFPDGSIRVVTLTSWVDWPRIRASLPSQVVLDAISTGDRSLDWPALSVVIDPAGECRILRDRSERTDDQWQLDQVSHGALAAPLHVLGRLPERFVDGLLERAHAHLARVAWCGGAALSPELERQFDIVIVNAQEAARLLRIERQSPRASAEALAHRADVPGAVRVVTGAGAAATAAAVREGSAVDCLESSPSAVPRDRIRTLKGVGDAFAASFLATCCFEPNGDVRERLDVAGGLAAAQETATRFITSEEPARG